MFGRTSLRPSRYAKIAGSLARSDISHHARVISLASTNACGSIRNQTRSVKTVSRRKLKDLDQGVIASDPLPLHESDDVVQYPSVLQGAKNNMIKFDQCVLLTRVGNFYELYFEHAEEYGPHLGLKVSSKKTNAGPVAMAGFPFWQLDRFLKLLVQDMNKHVAISEEFPASISSTGKSSGLLFDRKVARIVTPGTLIDEKFLDPYQNNFLLSIHVEEGNSFDDSKQSPVGIAWLDLSTGDFFTQSTTFSLLPSILLRISAREVLLPSQISPTLIEQIELVLRPAHDVITLHQTLSPFDRITDWNAVLETPLSSEAESMFTVGETAAAHLLLDYVRANLNGLRLQLRAPQRREARETMSIDRSSLRGLEILETSRDGFGKGSLFHAVRRTVTKSGARLLRDRLTSPSASLTEITARLDLVTKFHSAEALREQLISHLRNTHDVQRLVQKFTLNKGDADDMLCLARAIAESVSIHELLLQNQQATPLPGNREAELSVASDPVSSLLARISLQGPVDLAERVSLAIDEDGLNNKHQLEEIESAEIAALAQEVALSSGPEELELLPKTIRSKAKVRDQEVEVKEAWIMRREASDVLNRLHTELDSLKAQKEDLALRLSSQLSAPSLTLKWTPGLGHICHIKSATGFDRSSLEAMNARMVSSSKSTRSFYLSDWTRLGNSMDQVRGHIRSEEQRIFDGLRQRVIQNLVLLRRNARVMDELDVAISFATLATEQGWTRPILNDSQTHKVFGGRHPTVKLGLEEHGRSFVSNDLLLDNEQHIWIITGPNMAGKSTFLRQNALITILAQVGSYVPADYAEIGLVDQIFSRIGAADDLYRDQSTFMVEMLETAAILRFATSRSFVIMDEVGRGTTPEDGTAVAYASLHHLYHETKCRTLFATHFHALHDLTHDWTHVGRYCTDVREDESDSFSFIHKLRPGVNRESHALKVARMAGLPDSAIQVARNIFKTISKGTMEAGKV